MSNFPKVNSEKPNSTIVEIGTSIPLECELINISAENCEFHIYRIDKAGGTLDNQNEISFLGRKKGAFFESIESLSPKFSWLDADEEEIKLAFDVSYYNSRISCKHQILIIKKGEILVNLYWGKITGSRKEPKVRLYAEYSKNVDINESLVQNKSIEFPVFITRPKDIDRYLFEPVLGGIPPKSRYKGDSNYVTFSEKLKKKANINLVTSKEINLNTFFDHFYSVSLKANIEGGHYKSRGKKTPRDSEETKIFKRGFKYRPDEVFAFLRQEKILPELFYYEKEFIEIVKEIGKNGVKAALILKQIKERMDDIKKRAWKDLGKGAGKYVAGKIAIYFAGKLFEYYTKSIFKYRFYPEETKNTLENFTQKTNINRRRNDFEKWFRKRHAGLTPDDEKYKLLMKEANIALNAIGYHPLIKNRLKEREYNKVYKEKREPLIIIRDNWIQTYSEYRKIEKVTIEFLTRASTINIDN